MIPLVENSERDTQSFSEVLKKQIQYENFLNSISQMKNLWIDPQNTYDQIKEQKQFQDTWGRKDCSFVLIQMFFIFISSIAYSVCFRISSFVGFIKVAFKSIFINYLLFGIFISMILRFLTNTFLRKKGFLYSEQKVEMRYAFDVHCNSYFPYFMITHIIVYPFIPFINSNSLFSIFIGNFIFTFAMSCYVYITFLGYKILPFLHKTVLFLTPIAGLLIIFLIFSLSRISMVKIFLAIYFL
ncbi:protein unc-50 [Anaeramoeba ignava]|uniref:Protein unc-50 n=1 Tax=Anaeramoeba ignava TaxID=1746090 RepID=A0A9Q0R5C1_ANAIG|nr:protein unc-50 [Anaeramoeba ignava]